MRLIKLPINQAWVFVMAEVTVPVADRMIFLDRADAVSAAESRGLAVADDGAVSLISPNPQEA